MKRLSADRDELLNRLDLLFPKSQDLRPSEKVEDVVSEVCGFHVVDEALPEGQLAVCDFKNRVVLVNSRMGRFVHHKTNLQLLRYSTLAHELGHIRLHADEMAQACSIHYFGDGGQFTDSRAYQKEREADLYAGLFLVPIEEMLAECAIQNLLKNLKNGRQMSVGTLWKLIYGQAHRFQVSPSLMKRSLIELGWIQQGPSRKSGLKELSLRLKG